MVKLIATRFNLQRVLKSALPLRRQKECPIRFTRIDAQINFMPSNEVLILAKFYKLFFVDFESDDEWFLVDRKLVKIWERARSDFRKDKAIKFWTDSQYAHIQGIESGTHSTLPLLPIEEKFKKFPFQLNIRDSVDTLLEPTENGAPLHFNVLAKITIEELLAFYELSKKAETGLRWDGKTLELVSRHPGVNMFTHKLSSKLFLHRGDPLVVYFNWTTFQDLTKQFLGQPSRGLWRRSKPENEAWLGITKGGVVIGQAKNEFKLTYLLRAKHVDDEL
jgi:hypothetical protein